MIVQLGNMADDECCKCYKRVGNSEVNHKKAASIIPWKLAVGAFIAENKPKGT